MVILRKNHTKFGADKLVRNGEKWAVKCMVAEPYNVDRAEILLDTITWKIYHDWSTNPPDNVPPQEIAGLIKGLSTISLPYYTYISGYVRVGRLVDQPWIQSSWWGKTDVLEMAHMSHQKKCPSDTFHESSWLINDRIFITQGFQTPCVWRYWDPKNIPKTPSQEVFWRLG